MTRADIDHAPWALQPAEVSVSANTLTRIHGIALPAKPSRSISPVVCPCVSGRPARWKGERRLMNAWSVIDRPPLPPPMPRFRVPRRIVIGMGPDILLGRRRSFARDCAGMVRAMRPRPSAWSRPYPAHGAVPLGRQPLRGAGAVDRLAGGAAHLRRSLGARR
ncbi:MAG: hypothetical protein U0531_11720 [Dehalococcoidia bacterium]